MLLLSGSESAIGSLLLEFEGLFPRVGVGPDHLLFLFEVPLYDKELDMFGHKLLHELLKAKLLVLDYWLVVAFNYRGSEEWVKVQVQQRLQKQVQQAVLFYWKTSINLHHELIVGNNSFNSPGEWKILGAVKEDALEFQSNRKKGEDCVFEEFFLLALMASVQQSQANPN